MSSKSRRRSSKSLARLFTGSETHRERVRALKLGASRLDDVELDTALAAALRGDLDVTAARLSRTVEPVRAKRRRKRGYTPWREPIIRNPRKSLIVTKNVNRVKGA